MLLVYTNCIFYLYLSIKLSGFIQMNFDLLGSLEIIAFFTVWCSGLVI